MLKSFKVIQKNNIYEKFIFLYEVFIVDLYHTIYNYDDKSGERTQDETYLPDNFGEYGICKKESI